MTARVEALQRSREESPSGVSLSAGSVGAPSSATPHRPAATASWLHAAGDERAAERRDAAEREPDDESFLDLVASLAAPSQARHHARATLARWQLSPEVTSDSLTIVSELVANAIAACGIAPGQPDCPAPENAGPVTLALRFQPGRLVIEVTDPIPDPPAPAEPSLDAESGRGLMLVQALSTQWGCLPAARGKTVFAVLALPAVSDLAI